MKHVLGYGVLILGLAAVLVWGYKRVPAPAAGVLAGFPDNGGDDKHGNYLVELMEKGEIMYPGQHELSDHPANYKQAQDKTQYAHSFVWNLKDDPFTIRFLAGSVPCAPSDPKNPTDIVATVDDPAATKKSYTAKCTLLTSGSPIPTNVTVTLPNGKVHSGYSYSIVPTAAGPQGSKTLPTQTCDGCFLEID